jgi:hypothetical protein
MQKYRVRPIFYFAISEFKAIITGLGTDCARVASNISAYRSIYIGR